MFISEKSQGKLNPFPFTGFLKKRKVKQKKFKIKYKKNERKK